MSVLRPRRQQRWSAPGVQFPTNIELVKKYYDKIGVTTISATDSEDHPNSRVVRTINE